MDAPARHVDLLPTILDAAGVPPPEALSGASLRDVIGVRGGRDRPSYFEAMTPTLARGWAPLRGVIAGRDKFIDLPIPELYDLVADPREAQNGASTRADRARVLFNTLKGFNIAPPGRPQEETPDTLERLRSLGYIGGGSGTVREKFTEDDDPKRLIAIEQTMQRAAEARRAGRAGEAIAMYRDIIAQTAGYRGRVPAPGARLLAGRPAARRDRDARVGAQARRHAARSAHQARPVPDAGRPGAPGHRTARRRSPGTIPTR